MKYQRKISKKVSFSKKGTEGLINGFEYLARKGKSLSQNPESK